ncbi:MAG: protein kinase [Pirellulaceae bacterium]|nr:protein kinase [Pirellulaceae bacterium]
MRPDTIEGILGALAVDDSPALESSAELAAIEQMARWPLPKPDQFIVPERLREYQLLKEIGRGGMGTVHLAVHTRLKKHVAIKVLSSKTFLIPGAIERFEQEMQSLGRLNHPNIVQASDAGVCDDIHFLVMEFIEGRNLAQWIKQHGRMNVQDVCSILRQMCGALQAAHSQGLVHRDVKPSNIMLVDSPGTALMVKLLDLGLAKFYEAPSLSSSEVSGESSLNPEKETPREECIVGTFDYMAPEQAHHDAVPTAQMDLYSLGCTCFHLLVGMPPFRKPNATAREKLKAHANQPIPRVDEFRQDVPDWLTTLIARLMAKQPSDRPRSGAEVIAELDRRQSDQQRHRRSLGLAVVGLMFAFMLGGFVYRIATDRGTLEITPFDEAVQVVIEQNGRDVKVIDTQTTNSVELHSGEFSLKVADRCDVILDKSSVQLKRGEKVIVQLKWVSPGKWTDATREEPEESFKRVEKLSNVKKYLDGELALKGVTAILGEPIPEESLLRLPIKSMEISPNGKTVALVTSNYGRDETAIAGELILLDSRDGHVLHRLQPHASGINKVAWTPDSQLVLTAGLDGQLVITNPSAGKAFRKIEFPSQVSGIAVNQSGNLLAAASEATVYIINLQSGEILHRLQAEGNWLYYIAFRGDSELLSNGWESPNHIWNLADTPPSLRTFRKYQSESTDLFVPQADSKLLWTAGYDGRSILWNTDTGEDIAVLPHQWVSSSISANADNSLALTTEWHGGARIWDVKTLKLLRVICGNENGVVSRFLPDGKGVVAAGADGIIHAVDAATGESLWSKAPHRGIALQVALDSTSGILASAAVDGSVVLWDTKTNKLLKQLKHLGGRTIALEFRDQGKRLIAVTAESFVTEWEMDTHSVTKFDLAASTPNVRSEAACIDDKGQLIAMVRAGGGVELWDCQARQLVRTLSNVPSTLSKIEFTADQKVIWGIAAGALMRWDVQTGNNLPAPNASALTAGDLQNLGRVGDFLLTLQSSGVVSAFRDGEKAFEFASPHGDVSQFVPNPDGTQLMLVSHSSHAASVWNLTSNSAALARSLELSPPEIATAVNDVAWDSANNRFYTAHSFGVIVVGNSE